MASFEIDVPAGGRMPLSESPLAVGRGPVNDLVVTDDTISWHHAQLWVEANTAWLRDLGSRNGTFVNEARVVGAKPLQPGDTIRFGVSVSVQLHGQASESGAVRMRYLEALDAPVRLPFRSDRLTLGSDARCDLRVAEWPERAATLLAFSNGELVLGTDEGEEPLQLGEAFTIRGRKFQVIEVALDHAPTVDYQAFPYTYGVEALAEGEDGGPVAVLVDPTSRNRVRFTGNRGALLFVLARQLFSDRASSVIPDEEGWCSPEQCIAGIWGRGRKSSNHLNVLVHRTRSAVQEGGFDPWFIEKRRGGVRIRVKTVDVR